MATLSDIATRAGVSRTTVAYILRGQHEQVGIKAETREKVLEAADALGYRPNASARAVSTGRFGNIALLLSMESECSYLPAELLFGIHDALAELGQHLTFVRLPDESLTNEGFVPQVLREWMVDGLIVNYTHFVPERMLTLLEEHHLPSIWVNTPRKVDCVLPDDLGAGRTAAAHLLSLGHRHIVYVTQPTTHHSDQERWCGVQETVETAGGRAERWVYDVARLNPRATDWLGMVKHRLTTPDRPTAFVAYADYIAHPLLHMLTLGGFRVPDDFSLVSIHDKPDNDMGMELTTVILPEAEIGRTAVAMVQRKIKAPQRTLPTQVVPVTLRLGVSCAPVSIPSRR